jgi:hypothetical protein
MTSMVFEERAAPLWLSPTEMGGACIRAGERLDVSEAIGASRGDSRGDSRGCETSLIDSVRDADLPRQSVIDGKARATFQNRL